MLRMTALNPPPPLMLDDVSPLLAFASGPVQSSSTPPPLRWGLLSGALLNTSTLTVGTTTALWLRSPSIFCGPSVEREEEEGSMSSQSR